ncbi:MAG TPA: aromatic ring-hydroxylating dioxygenase subunit alpha [Sphingobium sp.]|nr:aromatic ring-hydroxylating dioxygenase subunit alpha [Sphingobium sp.]
MVAKFLEQVWYFGAWADELSPGGVKNVILADRDIALYRTETGELAAIGNQCPHRFAPLHIGKVKGEALECLYHGLRFGPSGRCVLSPHHNGAVPGAIRVPSYTAVERHGIVWLWLAQDAEPQPDLIPDLSDYAAMPESVVVRVPLIPVNANYQLLVDNLLDPSHGDFLHYGSIGDGRLSSRSPALTMGDNWMKADWSFDGVNPMPFLETVYSEPGVYDTWMDVRWFAPGIIRFEAGIKPSGMARQDGRWSVSYHFCMPSTEQTTHYDVRLVRNYDVDNLAMTESLVDAAVQAFVAEDKMMLELQQGQMKGRDFWEMGPTLLPPDVPAVKVRRQLQSMIAAEASSERVATFAD